MPTERMPTRQSLPVSATLQNHPLLYTARMTLITKTIVMQSPDMNQVYQTSNHSTTLESIPQMPLRVACSFQARRQPARCPTASKQLQRVPPSAARVHSLQCPDARNLHAATSELSESNHYARPLGILGLLHHGLSTSG